jgi:hypothetical protein
MTTLNCQKVDLSTYQKQAAHGYYLHGYAQGVK